jgi:transcriptional regulator with XRE-family HTH domain
MPKSSSQAPLQLDRSEEKLWALAGIGDRIQRARLDAGMSIEQVASALNITSSAVRQWELGRKFPSRPRLEAFARFVGADLGWLQTAVSNVARLADESGRALGHPVPILERHQIATLAEVPFSADFLKQFPWAWPSYPCSDQTFAFKVFNDWNAPDFQAGEVVLIDPKVQPMPGDMAVAVADGDDEVIFARIKGLSDADVRQLLGQLKEIIRSRLVEEDPQAIRKSVQAAVEREDHQAISKTVQAVADREATISILEEHIEHYDQLLRVPGKSWAKSLLQSVLQPLNPARPVTAVGSVRIVGVMVQHNRRPPPYSDERALPRG